MFVFLPPDALKKYKSNEAYKSCSAHPVFDDFRQVMLIHAHEKMLGNTFIYWCHPAPLVDGLGLFLALKRFFHLLLKQQTKF